MNLMHFFKQKQKSMTFKSYEEQWTETLELLYDQRESLTLFHHALEDCLGISRIEFLSKKSEMLSHEHQEKLECVLDELKSGKPYQHIVGFTYFGDLKISTSPAALIPRPETEELVYWILESVGQDSRITIEDYCTGTGCIPLLIKNLRPKYTLVGSDLSEEALILANQNKNALDLEVEFKKEDVLNPSCFDSLDILVSNPPYIPIIERKSMQDKVILHEPEMALFVPDEDPLLFYRELGEIGLKRLKSGGMLFFELHENFAIQTKSLIQGLGYKQVELKKDLQDKWRMLRAVR